MYALVDIKGKQYKAEEGSLLRIDRVKNQKGDILEFDSVLLLSDEDAVIIGQPYVKGIKVKAVVEEHSLDKKIIVFKYNRRKGYRNKRGHRQRYTMIRVEEIESPTSSKTAKAGPARAEATSKPQGTSPQAAQPSDTDKTPLKEAKPTKIASSAKAVPAAKGKVTKAAPKTAKAVTTVQAAPAAQAAKTKTTEGKISGGKQDSKPKPKPKTPKGKSAKA